MNKKSVQINCWERTYFSYFICSKLIYWTLEHQQLNKHNKITMEEKKYIQIRWNYETIEITNTKKARAENCLISFYT